MKSRTRKIAVVAACVVAALAGCGKASANSADIKGVNYLHPQKIEVYANIDQHLNIAVLCIHGVAFATTSREAAGAIMRVPELDGPFCGGSSK